jgi:flagellar protein FlaG
MVNNIQGGSATQSQSANNAQVQIVLNDGSQVSNRDRNGTEPTKSNAVASIEDIQFAVQELNSRIQTQQIQVNFGVDEDTGRIVVKVKDTESGEVIRQIPSEATLEFAHNASKGVGVTLDSTL